MMITPDKIEMWKKKTLLNGIMTVDITKRRSMYGISLSL